MGSYFEDELLFNEKIRAEKGAETIFELHQCTLWNV